jgi:hypothetical protein
MPVAACLMQSTSHMPSTEHTQCKFQCARQKIQKQKLHPARWDLGGAKGGGPGYSAIKPPWKKEKRGKKRTCVPLTSPIIQPTLRRWLSPRSPPHNNQVAPKSTHPGALKQPYASASLSHTTETNRFRFVLFGMQDRTLGAYLAAINRVVISVMPVIQRVDTMQDPTPESLST